MTGGERAGRARQALRSMVSSRTDFEASQERRHAARTGCTAVADVRDRTRAEVTGVLRSVTLRPRERVPALEAELYDGSGSLRVVWLGQRHIHGIEPGRRIRLEGLVSCPDGVRTVFNPRYELVTADVG